MICVIFWIQQCQRRIWIWQKVNFPIQLGFNSIQDHSWFFFFILMNNRKIKWFKCPSRVVDKWLISGIDQDPVKSSERNFRKYLKTFAFSEFRWPNKFLIFQYFSVILKPLFLTKPHPFRWKHFPNTTPEFLDSFHDFKTWNFRMEYSGIIF